MIRILFLLCSIALMTACAAPVEVPQRRAQGSDSLPAMKTFAPSRPAPPYRGNAGIARDFLALAFQMESGRVLDRLTRFEGPITIRLIGQVPPTAPTDLARLLTRLRAEAGLDISQITTGQASITVEFLPRRKLQDVVPQAACFVVPRVSSWAEYRTARRSDRVDWTTLQVRDRVAVFIPSDTAPQEVRDCLHEEVAQALGPLNDLYQLSDSVFNDDNFHAVLTGFDMLVLRMYYAPELANGMTRDEVAARLPALLARVNPGGGAATPLPPSPTPREWVAAIEGALGPRGSSSTRRAAAATAVNIARQQGWQDARLGFSYFALGRLSLPYEMDGAMAALSEAQRIYRSLPDAAIHVAHIEMQMAAFALSSDRPQDAITLVDQALPVVARAENAALLASLMMIRAEALTRLGRDAEARAQRMDSIGWARYGFGADVRVQARLTEIAVLSPN
jgi:hypothetical protein